MTIIQFVRAVLVDGKHVEENEIRIVGEDIDAEIAARLVREGCAEDITDELPDGVEAVELSSLKLDALKELAAAEGIDLGEAKTKAAIVEAIEKARVANANA